MSIFVHRHKANLWIFKALLMLFLNGNSVYEHTRNSQ